LPNRRSSKQQPLSELQHEPQAAISQQPSSQPQLGSSQQQDGSSQQHEGSSQQHDGSLAQPHNPPSRPPPKLWPAREMLSTSAPNRFHFIATTPHTIGPARPRSSGSTHRRSRSVLGGSLLVGASLVGEAPHSVAGAKRKAGWAGQAACVTSKPVEPILDSKQSGPVVWRAGFSSPSPCGLRQVTRSAFEGDISSYRRLWKRCLNDRKLFQQLGLRHALGNPYGSNRLARL